MWPLRCIQCFARCNNKYIRRFSSLPLTESKDVKRDHTPVMLKETLANLNLGNDQLIVDMTFGAGGHSQAILEGTEKTTVIALDRDPVGFENAVKLEELYPSRVIPLLGKFSQLPQLMSDKGYKANSVDAVLFDFGCSSMQFDTPSRGFSLNANGPLDMRMDAGQDPDQPTAMQILARASEEDLAYIFKVYGEEKNSKQIAQAIVEARYLFKKLQTTHDLAELVDSVCNDEIRYDKLKRRSHTATKVFQALRIFVNNELNEINYGVQVALRYLKIGGRMVTISFHSLEDTIVKRHIYGNIVNNVANPLPLKYSSHLVVHDEVTISTLLESNWQSLSKHVLVPSLEEVETNPRSRSAKMRVAMKIK